MRWRRLLPNYTASRDELLSLIDQRIAVALSAKPWSRNIFIPPAALYAGDGTKPFMHYSTCSAADFFHPRFFELSRSLNAQLRFHRKLWEWVFIAHIAQRAGIGPGKRALGFGVGREPLPAFLASLGAGVTATDAPAEIRAEQGWQKGEFSSSVDHLPFVGILDQERMRRQVQFKVCDMNHISEDLKDFDFCWSSCSLEHLGGLQNGIDFIIGSVNTLKPGGVACHTTEFNLSSDTETVEGGPTVIYRKCDLDKLVGNLRRMGHKVDDISVAPDAHHLDAFVDTPPYSQTHHLKLQLLNFSVTSVGIVIQKAKHVAQDGLPQI